MTDRDTERFKLAVDAVAAAFTLIARQTASSGTMEIIDLHRRLGGLRQGDENLLRRTLQTLHALAESPRLFAFRLVTTALTESLPRTCSSNVTTDDLRTAVSDLRQLANEATLLRAPDVAVDLTGIIATLIGGGCGVHTPGG